jgi:hypothetical protein
MATTTNGDTELADTLRDVLVSRPPGCDRPITLVETTDDIANMLNKLAKAVMADASPGRDATDGTVGCLTEAVMGVTAGLVEIAGAINNLAEAVREREDVT